MYGTMAGKKDKETIVSYFLFDMEIFLHTFDCTKIFQLTFL